MVKRKRNYKTEYRRRITRALAKGQTRAQARGHRRQGERLTSAKRRELQIEDAKLRFALKVLRKDRNFTKAAKAAQISPERLRRYAIEHKIVIKRGRYWIIRSKLPRRVLIYTRGRALNITVGNFPAASLIGKYMNAVKSFLVTNDPKHIKPFTARYVTDVLGKPHFFETRPNVLYRLSHAGGASFEQVYRIVV